jgi:hypothetical protein
MRTLFVAIGVVSLLGSPVCGQDVTASPPEIKTAYDRVRDETTVTFDRLVFGDTVSMGYDIRTRGIALIVSYKVPGQLARAPDSVELRFVRFGRLLPDRRAFWQYNRRRDLSLLIDDSVRMHFEAAQYDSIVLVGTTAENIRYRVAWPVFERLLKAQTAEGVLGEDTRLLFTKEQLGQLAQLNRAPSVPPPVQPALSRGAGLERRPLIRATSGKTSPALRRSRELPCGQSNARDRRAL